MALGVHKFFSMPTVAELDAAIAQLGGAMVPSSPSNICGECGHTWSAHEAHATRWPYPTEGWITCPADHCSCRTTWSLDDESKKAFDRSYAAHPVQESQGERNH